MFRIALCIDGMPRFSYRQGANVSAGGGNKMANASSISRMISSAGFQKSSEGTTRIPGYHVFTEGFKVENGSSSVLVRYEFGSSVRSNYEAANVRRDQVMAYVALLDVVGEEFDQL